MRANTVSFRKNAFKTLRAQGVSCAKAMEIAELLGRQIAWGTRIPEGAEIKVSMDAANEQSVCIAKDGLALLHLDTFTLRKLQPLVNTAPTARQLELQEEMEGMIGSIYAAMALAEAKFANEHGTPHDERDYAAEKAFVQQDAGYKAVLAAYEAKKNESLAINPYVDAFVVDPEAASFWYEWHREAYNFRPTGFHTLAMIKAEMERMPREIMYEAA